MSHGFRGTSSVGTGGGGGGGTPGVGADFIVRLATAANLPAFNAAGAGPGKTITGVANGPLSVDGIVVVAGDFILVKNPAPSTNNGIYVVTQVGVAGVSPFILTRATFADTGTEMPAGTIVVVTEGATLADTIWLLSTNNPITIDVTPLTFTQFGAVPIAQNLQGAYNAGPNGNIDTTTVLGPVSVTNTAIVAVAANTLLQLDGQQAAANVDALTRPILVFSGKHGAVTSPQGAIHVNHPGNFTFPTDLDGALSAFEATTNGSFLLGAQGVQAWLNVDAQIVTAADPAFALPGDTGTGLRLATGAGQAADAVTPGGNAGLMEIATETGGAGSAAQIAGIGGELRLRTGAGGADNGSSAGAGGPFNIETGQGQPAVAGLSAAGDGGTLTVTLGQGGNLGAGSIAGQGGSLDVVTGQAGTGDAFTGSRAGHVYLQTRAGSIPAGNPGAGGQGGYIQLRTIQGPNTPPVESAIVLESDFFVGLSTTAGNITVDASGATADLLMQADRNVDINSTVNGRIDLNTTSGGIGIAANGAAAGVAISTSGAAGNISIGTTNGNIGISAAGAGNDVLITAADDGTFAPAGDLFLISSVVGNVALSTVDGDITMNANGTHQITGVAADLISFSTTGNVADPNDGDIRLTTVGSGAQIELTTTNANIVLDANGIGGAIQANGNAGVFLNTVGGTQGIFADTLDNDATAFLVREGGVGGRNYILVNTTNGTEAIVLGNVTTTPDVTVTSGSTTVTASGAGGSIALSTADGPITVTAVGAGRDVTISAPRDVICSATDDVVLTCSDIIDIDGSNGVTIDANVGTIAVATVNGAITLNAGNAANGDITLTAGDDIIMVSNNVTTITTTAGSITLDANGAGADVNISADDDVFLTATDDIIMNSTGDTTSQAANTLLRVNGMVADDANRFEFRNVDDDNLARIYCTGDFVMQNRSHIDTPFLNGVDANHWVVSGAGATLNQLARRGGAMSLVAATFLSLARLQNPGNGSWLSRDGRAFFLVDLKLTSTSEIRVEIGIEDAAGAGQDYSRIIFDTASGFSATNWYLETSNDGGATVTQSDSGVAASVEGTQLIIAEDTASGSGSAQVNMLINGVLLGTNAATLPVDATLRNAYIQVTSNSAVIGKTIECYRAYVSCRNAI